MTYACGFVKDVVGAQPHEVLVQLVEKGAAKDSCYLQATVRTESTPRTG